MLNGITFISRGGDLDVCGLVGFCVIFIMFFWVGWGGCVLGREGE